MTAFDSKNIDLMNFYGTQTGSLNLGQITSQIGQLTGGSYAEIAWFNEALQAGQNTFGSGNSHEQRVSGIQGLVNTIFSWINKAGKAENDVNESNEKIKDAEIKANEIAEKTNTDIQSILNEINENTKNIQTILDELEKIGEDIEAKEKALEAQKQIVDENIAILNSDDKTTEEKEAAIGKIQGASEAIKALAKEVTEYSEKIYSGRENVVKYTAEIDEKNVEAQSIIAENIANIEGIKVTTSTDETKKNVEFEKIGGEEVAESIELQAKAGIENTNLFTAAGGAIDQQKALDLMEAGKTHISGGGKNLTTLATSIGNMTGNLLSLSDLIMSVGSEVNNSANVIGQYNTKVSGIINSIGSWESITTVTEELDNAVSKYEENLCENIETKTKEDNEKKMSRIFETYTHEFEFDTNKLTLGRKEKA